MKQEHYWTDCDFCEARTVICGECGNNCCNGGHGALANGAECPSCPSAYDMQDAGENN